MNKIAFALLAATMISLPANAQSFNLLSSIQHWNLDAMTRDEQVRINNGVANGSITRNEASRLQDQLNQINNMKARMSANGISPKERQKLDNKLDKLAQNIFKASKNNNHRNSWLGSRPYSWTNRYLSQGTPFRPAAAVTPATPLQIYKYQERLGLLLKAGTITPQQSEAFQTRINEINRENDALSADGLSWSERNRLEGKLTQLGNDMDKAERHASRPVANNRYDGHDRHDRDYDHRRDDRNNGNYDRDHDNNDHHDNGRHKGWR